MLLSFYCLKCLHHARRGRYCAQHWRDERQDGLNDAVLLLIGHFHELRILSFEFWIVALRAITSYEFWIPSSPFILGVQHPLCRDACNASASYRTNPDDTQYLLWFHCGRISCVPTFRVWPPLPPWCVAPPTGGGQGGFHPAAMARAAACAAACPPASHLPCFRRHVLRIVSNLYVILTSRYAFQDT